MRGLLRPQSVQNQRDRAGDQHVVGEVEDRAIEADRVDVEVNEVADVPERQPVVAIAHRTGHDQAQSDREHPVRGRSQDEQVVEDHDRGDDRETGEDQAAVRYRAPQSPTDAPVL